MHARPQLTQIQSLGWEHYEVHEPVHEPVCGDDSVRAKQQESKQRPALCAGGRDVGPVRSRLEPTEQPEVHLVLIVARRRGRALVPR